ncbi:MAG: hypothetical protein AAGB93_00215 [Planctomycetota bacterium]
MRRPRELVVTRRTALTSLGSHTTQALAAARAGLVRTSEFPYHVASPGDEGDLLLLAHAAHDVTEGFDGAPRLARLVAATLTAHATEYGPLPTGTRMYASLPDPGRRARTVALLAEDAREAALEELDDGEREPLDADAATALLESAAAASNWGGPLDVAEAVGVGHTGVVRALERAATDVEEGRTEVALVAGFDTLLTGRTIEWLDRVGRLKSPTNATGLPPGEAGVLVAIETAERARSRGAAALASVDAIAFAKDPHPFDGGDPAQGGGLDAVLEQLEPLVDERAPQAVVDQNGEVYRGMDWGFALHRAAARGGRLDAVRTDFTAGSFGDTAAASAGLGLCVALHALERDPACGDSVLVLSSSDGADRAGVVLRRIPRDQGES